MDLIVNEEEETQLHKATEEGDLELVQELLAQGAQVEAERPLDLRTALHLASASAQEAIVRLLIEKGADVEHVSEESWTPLFLASYYGHRQIIALLISSGAKMRNDFTSALYCATHPATIVDLVNAGADVDAVDMFGRTALHTAVNSEVVEVLIKLGATVDFKDNEGQTPLHVVSQRGDENLVACLLERGLDVNCTDLKRRTPLHLASAKLYLPIIVSLLKRGADLNAVSEELFTALDYAWSNAANAEQDHLIAVTNYIEEYIAMMRSVHLYTSPNFNKVNNAQLKNDAADELVRLKQTLIPNTNLTLHNFLGKTKHQLVLTLSNESVVSFFQADSNQEFPHFDVLFQNQFNRGMRRKHLVDRVLAKYYQVFRGLLPECTLEILTHLKDETLFQLY